MLVINRVELVALDQAQKVGDLERRYAIGGQDDLDAPDEIVDIGYVSHDVVGRQQVGGPSLSCQPGRKIAPEELDD